MNLSTIGAAAAKKLEAAVHQERRGAGGRPNTKNSLIRTHGPNCEGRWT